MIECLAEWGRSVGLCFQLMDDLIDVLSDSATLGKPTGSDVAQGKQTLMVIHALSQPDSEAKARLLSVLGKCEDATEAMVQDGIAALDELGSIAYAAKEQTNIISTLMLALIDCQMALQCLLSRINGPSTQAFELMLTCSPSWMIPS